MTNKPMLSVERQVIEDILADAREPGHHYMAARKVLRALLDKPVKADLVECDACPTSGGCVSVCMKATKPAAQHQGEPVFMKPQYLSVPGLWIECKEGDIHAKPFYAEQPAPVAVTHTMKSIMEAVEASRCYTVLTSDQCHALAQALNEVKP